MTTMHFYCPLRRRRCRKYLLFGRAIVIALSVVASSGANHDILTRRKLWTAPIWLWSGKNLRGSSSSLEHPIRPVATVDERELHSKSAKSKSSKAKFSKSKSSKISLTSDSSSDSSSSSSSSKGSKSYTSTSKSGKSKSAKGSSDSKSAKGESSDNSFDTEGSAGFYNENSSNEYEMIIPTISAQVNTSLVLHDKMDLPGNPDESAISNSVPDSEYTTLKIAEGSHNSGSDGSISSSSSSTDDAINDDAISYDVEPIILDGNLTTEVRIAEGESEFIDGEVMEKGGPNEELIEDEAILDFSSESLE